MGEKRKKIGILTSGGDAPGMNAAIRAVVRTAVYHNIKVTGIERGFEGLLSGEIKDLKAMDVSDIIHKGGTVLLTARCPEMVTEEGQKKASEICRILGIDTLVVIGGDGSFKGAHALSKLGVNVMCIPATIDLDMSCTEYSVGFDTAVNTGMEAISKIRDTSSSHERCSVVEVMGRDAGYIALWCGMTGGAEEVLIPEFSGTNTETILEEIISNRAMGKKHNLIVVAEGIGGSVALAKEIQRVTGIQSRATILGHLQRGGSPTATDRMHASVMGFEAVKCIVEGHRNKVMVFRGGKHAHMDLEEALHYERPYDNTMYEMIKILAK